MGQKVQATTNIEARSVFAPKLTAWALCAPLAGSNLVSVRPNPIHNVRGTNSCLPCSYFSVSWSPACILIGTVNCDTSMHLDGDGPLGRCREGSSCQPCPMSQAPNGGQSSRAASEGKSMHSETQAPPPVPAPGFGQNPEAR